MNFSRSVKIFLGYDGYGLWLGYDYNESESDMMNEKKKRMIQFLGKQLIARDKRRYYSDNMKDAVNLFLRNRCAYKALRELLILPCRNIITSYFGKLGLPGECKKKTFQKYLMNSMTVKNVGISLLMKYMSNQDCVIKVSR